MSAAAKLVVMLATLVAMAVAGRKPAEVAAELASLAGDYWPHLQPLLCSELDRAAELVPDIATHRPWFDALAAELTGKGKGDGRTTAKRKPASSKAAAGESGKPAGRARRGKGNA